MILDMSPYARARQGVLDDVGGDGLNAGIVAVGADMLTAVSMIVMAAGVIALEVFEAVSCMMVALELTSMPASLEELLLLLLCWAIATVIALVAVASASPKRSGV